MICGCVAELACLPLSCARQSLLIRSHLYLCVQRRCPLTFSALATPCFLSKPSLALHFRHHPSHTHPFPPLLPHRSISLHCHTHLCTSSLSLYSSVCIAQGRRGVWDARDTQGTHPSISSLIHTSISIITPSSHTSLRLACSRSMKVNGSGFWLWRCRCLDPDSRIAL